MAPFYDWNFVNKPLVIYHGNCADGFGAAWSFWHCYRDTYDYHAGYFNLPPPDVTGKEVFLVDFSYKRAVVVEMLKTAKKITLIDHHISAIKDLDGLYLEHENFQQYTNVNNSGAMLAWKWCFDDGGDGIPKPPVLLQIIEDRDLWRFNIPITKAVSAALFSYPYDFKVWDELMTESVNRLEREGEAILRKMDKDIAEFLPIVTRTVNIQGYRVPCANVPYFWCSEVGNILCKGVPFAATYYDASDRRVWSLRSDNEDPNATDVSAICVQFGGGGHKNAGGFSHKLPLLGDDVYTPEYLQEHDVYA